MSQDSFKGKVVLITGAAHGIAAATAKKFAQLGAILSLLDIQSELLQEVVEECHALGEKFKNPKPYFLVGDLTNDDIRKQYVENTVKNFGHIDILLNICGMSSRSSILSTPMDEYDRLFNVNVRTVYDMCRLTVPHLIKTKGCIVNVASITAHTACGMTIYSACKAALKHMTKCLADELGCYQIRVVSISPGPIYTGFKKQFGADGEKIFETYAKLTLLERCGKPSETANLIAFLASEDANYINGTDILIDGGFIAKRRV